MAHTFMVYMPIHAVVVPDAAVGAALVYVADTEEAHLSNIRWNIR